MGLLTQDKMEAVQASQVVEYVYLRSEAAVAVLIIKQEEMADLVVAEATAQVVVNLVAVQPIKELKEPEEENPEEAEEPLQEQITYLVGQVYLQALVDQVLLEVEVEEAKAVAEHHQVEQAAEAQVQVIINNLKQAEAIPAAEVAAEAVTLTMVQVLAVEKELLF